MTEPTSIFILDNGAYTIKANYSPYNDPYGLYTAEPGPSKTSKKKSSKKTKRGKKNANSNNKNKEQQDAVQVEEVQPVDPYEPRVFQNCLVRTRDKKVYFGADIEDVQDHGGLVYRRPFEKVSRAVSSIAPPTHAYRPDHPPFVMIGPTDLMEPRKPDLQRRLFPIPPL